MTDIIPIIIGKCTHCGAEVWAEYPNGKMKLVWRHDKNGCRHEVDTFNEEKEIEREHSNGN